jgi:hypothetical protein
MTLAVQVTARRAVKNALSVKPAGIAPASELREKHE